MRQLPVLSVAEYLALSSGERTYYLVQQHDWLAEIRLTLENRRQQYVNQRQELCNQFAVLHQRRLMRGRGVR